MWEVVLVGFHGISTLEGYLMPNPVYMICKQVKWFGFHFVNNIIKWAWAHFFFHTNGFKYCYVMVTICHQSFIYTHLNGYTWFVSEEFAGDFIF